jgi:hypothetical protein
MKKGQYSKIIVAIVIILNVAFAIGSLYAFIRVGKEPKALITTWFTWTTGELWLLAKIKKQKILKKKDGNENGSN